jgi:predicted phosphodiesterase
MIAAVFSDIHGNLPALETFVNRVRGKVDACICLGDVVNYGPWNNECLELLYQLPGLVLLEGNHERLFLGTEDLSHEIPLVQDFFRHSFRGFNRFDLISNLPQSHRLGDFLCVHTINNQKIYADTPVEPETDYFIGHTHHQFRIRRNGHEVINCGSIGQNRNQIDFINYALLDTSSREVTLCKEIYPFDRLIEEMTHRGYSQTCLDYYLNKKKTSQP